MKLLFTGTRYREKVSVPRFLLLLTNNKGRFYLCFSSGNVTDFCGLASLKSMYTVTGSGRLCELIMSVLRDLCEDDSKVTSLSTENTVSACPLLYSDTKSCRVGIMVKTRL